MSKTISQEEANMAVAVALQRNVADLEREIESLKAENAALRERLDKWNKGYNSVTKSHYTSEIESLKAQAKHWEDTCESQHEETIEPLRKKAQELYKENESIKAQLAECRDKALEEAAEIAGTHFIYGHSVAGPAFAARCAENIRSLKGENHDPE